MISSADSAATGASAGIATIIIIVIGLAAYFAPAIIAIARKHHQALAISVLTFLAGWTVIGWIAAMVWACSNPAPSVTAQDYRRPM